jgi:hypothetical protein
MLLKGLLFGFVLAAIVGPMWVLCFRRTIEQGVAAGMASGLGIAVADAIYGAIRRVRAHRNLRIPARALVLDRARRRRVPRMARRQGARRKAGRSRCRAGNASSAVARRSVRLDAVR